MNLAIDIGNSRTHFGLYEGKKLFKSFEILTHRRVNKYEFYKKYFSRYKDKITNIGISSVVPSVNKFWNDFAINYLKFRPLFINNKIKLDIKFKVDKSSAVGADRICNSVFGHEYFKRKANVIVIDMGTATTYDVILKNGDFIGGIIAPGIQTSAKALFLNTAKLPLLNFEQLKFGKSVIAKNTVDSISYGLLYYALFAVEGIIKAIEKERNRKFKVIITGGFAKTIQKKLRISVVYIENTVLEGINIILSRL